MGVRQENKGLKIAVAVLAVLCGLSLAALGGVLIYRYTRPAAGTAAVVSNNYISPNSQWVEENGSVTAKAARGSAAYAQTGSTTGQPVRLALHQSSSKVNVPFAVQNFLPGDAATQSYSVAVSHQNSVTVFFGVSVRQGGQKLAEALCLKVVLANTGQTLYNGPVAAVPGQLSHSLAAARSNRVDDLNYSVTAYLPTQTGNAYQNLKLIADFNWWVENSANLGPAPKTGDWAVIWPCTALFAASGAALVLLKMCRREGAKNESE